MSVNVMHIRPLNTSYFQVNQVEDLDTRSPGWYGMVWYGNTLFNNAGPDSNLLVSCVSTGGVKTLTIYKKEKKEEIFTREYFWCDHNYHLAIISSNNILKLVDRFGYLCVKREAIPQFSPTIIETL